MIKRTRKTGPQPLPPLEASGVTGQVELTPPAAEEVIEAATQESAADIQRYLRWADQALNPAGDAQRGKKAA